MTNAIASNPTCGIFDHFDEDGRNITEQYADRLVLAEAYDRLGFYAYHLAEHHCTPHGRSPSPNLFLSSVIQRTRRLRVSQLVMLLNLYHPLRAFEEICMLDHLSNGRLEVGIGRGSLPMELTYFGVDPDVASSRYEEASQILANAMNGGVLNYRGQHFVLDDVPLTLSPHQRPHPRHGSPQTGRSPPVGLRPTAQTLPVSDRLLLFAKSATHFALMDTLSARPTVGTCLLLCSA